MVPPSDSLEAWIDYAERYLHGLAHDLRRVPFVESTRRMHLRALELKRAIARWKEERPDVAVRAAAVDEVEALAREARGFLERPTIRKHPPVGAAVHGVEEYGRSPRTVLRRGHGSERDGRGSEARSADRAISRSM